MTHRIIIELSEEDLKLKLEAALGDRIAKITNSFIESHVANIVSVKFERLNVEKAAKDAAESIIKKQYGEPATYNSNYSRFIKDIITEKVEAQLKLGFRN